MKSTLNDIPAECYTPDYYRLHRKRYLMRDAWVEKRLWDVVTALRPHAGETILDVGCGIGMIALECRKWGAAVTAIDYAEAALRTARDLELAVFGDHRIRYQRLQADRIQSLPETFDKIVAADFIEHISPEIFLGVLCGAAERLRPGGLLVLYTPNGFHQATVAQRLIRRLGLLPPLRLDELKTFAERRRSRIWYPGDGEEGPPDQRYEYLHVDVKSARNIVKALRSSGFKATKVSVSRSSSRLQALPYPYNLLWGGHLCVSARKTTPVGG
jgi:SAM-dependent methyltransferase